MVMMMKEMRGPRQCSGGHLFCFCVLCCFASPVAVKAGMMSFAAFGLLDVMMTQSRHARKRKDTANLELGIPLLRTWSPLCVAIHSRLYYRMQSRMIEVLFYNYCYQQMGKGMIG